MHDILYRRPCTGKNLRFKETKQTFVVPRPFLQSVLPLREQVADAMEIIIMTILSQQLRREWRLEGHEVALTSSVRKPTPRERLGKVGGPHHSSSWSQVVFLAIAIGSLIWGIVCDKYGRRIVSLTHHFPACFIDLTATSPCETGSDHFHVRLSVFWLPEHLCSRVQLALVPTVPRGHRDRGKPSGVGPHLRCPI